MVGLCEGGNELSGSFKAISEFVVPAEARLHNLVVIVTCKQNSHSKQRHGFWSRERHYEEAMQVAMVTDSNKTLMRLIGTSSDVNPA
ncbi:hypothetical protein ANN_01229 [Periplaneta americana]|uniref:Uncharacterized protein n=1 Tax=Periplaneta americana TaxID=6978 RepID=A0ABQ8TVF9_PERAM|nr:hypothetical protein ANN_01229 [Periplaneta americana]